MEREDTLANSRRLSFQSNLIVAGAIGKVAHKYHNNNPSHRNFNNSASDRRRRTRGSLVGSLLSGEASKKKQEVRTVLLIDIEVLIYFLLFVVLRS